MPFLTEKHRSDLHRSGLTDRTIETAGFYTVDDADEYRRLANVSATAYAPVPALAIPYPGCPGYVRLRPDSNTRPNPEYRGDSFGHDYQYDIPTEVSGPKYISAVGAAVRLYKPVDICPAIFDEKVPLMLTEGEKKTLAVAQSGIACIGAPGVTCFGDTAGRWASKGSGRAERHLHRDFDGVPLAGRKVIISFDSDIEQNEQVFQAAIVLAGMLEEEGSDVCIAYLEPASDGSKQGLDDYFMSLPEAQRLGPEPFKEVVQSARPFNVVECLKDSLYNDWEYLGRPHQNAEIGRLVRRACHLFTRKNDLQKFLKQCVRELHVRAEYVERFVVKVRKEPSADPRAWVAEWTAGNRVTFECRNSADVYVSNGHVIEAEMVLTRMALDAVTFGGPMRQSIADALLVWTHSAREAAMAVALSRLQHRPALDDSAARQFVRALTGGEDPVDVSVIKHFVWQVKRKLFDLPVEHHLMPIVVQRKQGAGKSEAIRRFLGPVEQFKDEPSDLTVVGDERQSFRFARAYVVFIDEMAKAAKTDMDAFKNRISQEFVSWRVLGSNLRETQPNRATLIGASNWTVAELIYDPSGVRRFYQLNCQERVDWAAVNTIDYDALWASIDENGPAPILEVLDDLRQRQEQTRVRDAAEEFLASRCTVGTTWTTAADVFTAFKQFLDDENYQRVLWTSQGFGRRLTSMLQPEQKKTSNGVWYQISANRRPNLTEQVEQYLAGRTAQVNKEPAKAA